MKTLTRRRGMDCICTVDQVKNGTHDPNCDWCDAGFECNPDLSDPEIEFEVDRL